MNAMKGGGGGTWRWDGIFQGGREVLGNAFLRKRKPVNEQVLTGKWNMYVRAHTAAGRENVRKEQGRVKGLPVTW